ncbi:MAG: hypothetical protein HOY71_01405, partial [Nonomuraea sp.]|nr:hypothetical protein [Nonomuraea sp.]
VTCKTSGDGRSATYTGFAVRDGKRAGEFRAARRCGTYVVDRHGRRVMEQGGNGWELIDLATGTRVSQTWIESQTSVVPVGLVGDPGRQELLTRSAESLVLTALREPEQRIGNPTLLKGGRQMIAQTDGGARLRLMETGEPQRTLAEVTRTGTPKGLNAFGGPVLDDAELLVADAVAPGEIVVRALPALGVVSRVRTAKPPEGENLSYRFDGGDLITVAGRRLERWDVATGRRTGALDVAGPGSAVTEVQLSPWNANHLMVAVRGQDYLHTIDLRTGRELKELRLTVGPDVVSGFMFDRSGAHLLLFRDGWLPEVWTTHPLKRVLGPLRSAGENLLGGERMTSLMPENSGKLFLFSDLKIRVFGLGAERVSYEEAYTFRQVQDFLAMSPDGSLLLRLKAGDSREGYVTDLLSLDVGTWERRLCRVLGRPFTAEDRQQVPIALPDRVC